MNNEKKYRREPKDLVQRDEIEAMGGVMLMIGYDEHAPVYVPTAKEYLGRFAALIDMLGPVDLTQIYMKQPCE